MSEPQTQIGDSVAILDPLGRTPIAAGMKAQIEAEFAALPQNKRGAILVIANERGATAHLAAKFGDHWKVAAGAGFAWHERRPSGWASVEFAW